MASKNFPVSRHQELVVQELMNEVLIYDLKNDKAFCLNETSALVWKLSDGTKSVSEITESVAGNINSPVTEDFVWLALDQLKKENLLDNGEELFSGFNHVSRRELIRRIGLTSVVALPVISSLVAPTAALSQSSCVALTDPCDPKGAPCCLHYGGPTACTDLGGGSFVCLQVTV